MEKKLDIRKRMMIAASIVILMFIALISVVYASNSKTNLTLKKKTVTVEYGKTISTNAKDYLTKDVEKDVIKNTTVTMKTENEKDKDYPTIGTHKVTLSYGDEKAVVEVKVKDTVKPEFNTCDSIEVLKDGTINYADYVKAEDLSEVKVTFEDKEVNLAVAGEYVLKATATDTSKNKATKDVKVIVKEIDITNNDVTVETDEKGNVVLKVTEKPVEQSTDVSTANAGSTTTRSSGNSSSTYRGGGTTGSNYSPNTGTGGSASSQAPAQHRHVYSTFGNYFHTDTEANTWAFNYLISDENVYYNGYIVHYCSCGLIGIDFWE